MKFREIALKLYYEGQLRAVGLEVRDNINYIYDPSYKLKTERQKKVIRIL